MMAILLLETAAALHVVLNTVMYVMAALQLKQMFVQKYVVLELTLEPKSVTMAITEMGMVAVVFVK